MTSNRYDGLGITSATICLVHCIGTPFLIGAGWLGFENETWTYFFILIGFIAIYHTTKQSPTGMHTWMLWISFWGFLFSMLFKEEFEWLHDMANLFSVFIIVGHLLNIRRCRKCADSDGTNS